MSNLIISLSDDATPIDGPLEGRTLMLNTAVATRFQCCGFCVTRNSPIQVVPRHAQEMPLRAALADKRLLDVTGQEAAKGSFGKMIEDIDNAIKSHTLIPIKEGEEIGPKVIMGTDAKGNTYAITPKDDADYNRMLEEIRLNGTLRVERPKQKDTIPNFTGLSSVFVEDLPAAPAGE